MRGVGRGKPPPDRFFESTHFWQQKIILTACKLDVFTHIAGGARTSAEVARAMRADPRATEVLLNALVACEYLKIQHNGYANEPIADAYLVKDRPGYLGYFGILDHDSWELWGRLADAVTTGRSPAPTRLYRDDRARTFHLLMGLHTMGESEAPKMARRLELARAKRLLDLGGGVGTYAIAFARKYPRLRVTLFDLPMALEFGRPIREKSGVADRIETMEGDFQTDDLGARYDAVFLSNVLHFLPPEQCAALIAKAAKALAPRGRLFVHDWILDEDRTKPVEGASFSVLMMLENDGARCYSQSEIETWIADAGLKQARVVERHALLSAVRR